MSSWPPSAVGRVSLLLLAQALACSREPAEQTPTQASAPPPAPKPAIVPWFQGTWSGSSAAADPPDSAPISANLTIDAAGSILGSSSLDLSLRGRVDGDSARLEAEGPAGHGVAVLYRQTGLLQGVLHYAAVGADQGKSARLTLTRAELP